MNEEYLKALYEQGQTGFDLGTYDEFKKNITSDVDFRKAFYESASDLDLGNYDDFELALKKKEPTTTDSSQPVAPSIPSGADLEQQRSSVASHYDKLVAEGKALPTGKERKLRMLTDEEIENIPYSARKNAGKNTALAPYLAGNPILEEKPEITGVDPANVYGTDVKNTNYADVKNKMLDASIKQMERSNEYSQLKVASQDFEKYASKNYQQKDIKGAVERFKAAQTKFQNTGEGADELRQREAELEENLSTLDKDYINMTLTKGNRENWMETADKYDEIQAKKAEGKELSDAEKEFLFDTRQNALGALAASERVKIMEMEDAVDLNTFNKEMAMQTAIVSDQKDAKYPELYNQKLASIIQKTGVNQAVLDELNSAYASLSDLQKAADVSEKQNANIVYERFTDDGRSRVRERDSNVVSEFGRGVIGAMGFMTLKTAQLPKSLGIGEPGEYDFTDSLYDSVESTVKGAQGSWGALDNAPSYLKYAYGLGQGVGSVAMFAGGGGTANLAGVPQKLGTMASAFLLSQPDNYAEAISSGLDETNARIVANLVSIVEGAAEGLVDDPKVFSQTVKKTLFSEIKKGRNVKEAFKLAMKQAPESVATVAKSAFEEGSEELTQSILGDLTKEAVNTAAGRQYFQDTFDAEAYKEAFLTGGMTGGFMKFFASRDKKSPETVEAMRDAVDMRDEIVANIEPINPELAKEVREVLDTANEAKTAIESHSKWNDLTTEAQNKALDLVWQMELAKDAKKRVEQFGIEDGDANKNLESLTQELNTLFNQPKSNTAEVLEEVKKDEDGIVEQEITAEDEQQTPNVSESSGGELAAETDIVDGSMDEAAVQETEEVKGVKPKNLRDLYSVNRNLFGQNRVKSLASAIVMDKAIGTMAKRAGVTKDDMYGRLEFRKANGEDLPQGVKLQVDAWHGSPYQFDKFTTEKIGTGEGAQAFGWGLYFTDLKDIAEGYAKSLSTRGILNKDIPLFADIAIREEGTKNKADLIKNLNSKLNDDIHNPIAVQKAIDYVNANSQEELNNLKSNGKPTRVVYRTILHKGKSPDEYTWLEWDNPVNDKSVNLILNYLKSKGVKFEVSNVDGIGRVIKPFDTNANLRFKTGEDIYISIKNLLRKDKNTLGSPKEASLFLLESGIDGIKYPAESIARGATSNTARGFNYVVFDENAVSIDEVIKFQKDANKAKGAAMVNMDGTAVIYALTDPDVSTPLHEIAHVFEHYMDEKEKTDVIESAGTDGWTTETSEYFARGFEKYLSEGVAPTKMLQKIFDKFKEWLTDIYNGIKDSEIDIRLNKKMREVYSSMLGTEPMASEKKTKKQDQSDIETKSENLDTSKTKETTEPEKKKTSKRTLFGRAQEGTDSESLKAALEKYGLDRDVENRLDANVAAKDFVREVGADAALEALRRGEVGDTASAFVFSELIDSVEDEMIAEKDPEKFKQLEEYQTSLIDEFDKAAARSARFLGALQDVYRTAKFNYKASRKIEEYKEKNGGEIPADIEQKFKDLEDKLKAVEERLKAAEEKAKKDEEARFIGEIKTGRAKPKSFTERAKKAADDFRNKYKTTSFTLKDSDGNPIQTQGLTFNDIVEIGAKAIEVSGKIADGVAAMIEKLKEQKWYQDLSDKDKKAVDDQVEKTFSKVYVPPALIKDIVESGVDTVDGLVSKVMEEIGDQFPNANERDFRDAITGYGKEVVKTKNDLQDEINRLKRVAVLTSKIEDAKNRVLKAKTPSQKRELSEQERSLKKELDNILEMSGIKGAERTERAKESVRKKIDDLQRRIKEGDFSKAQKKVAAADAELDALRTEKQKYQEEFDTEMHKLELKNRTKREKIIDGLIEAFGLTRALMATAEVSFILIQGGIQTIAHPINAARAFKKAKEHFASESKSKAWGDFVKAQPWYQKAKKSRLALSEYDAKLTAREEQYLGGWVNNIWDIVGYGFTRPFSKNAYEWWKRKNVFKALERASVGYLNTLRALRFQDAVNMLEAQGKTFETNPQEFKDAADVINTMTGRASLGFFEGIAKPLSVVFFSPRNWASVIKTSTPMALYHFGKMGQKGTYKPSVAQKMALGDYMKFVGLTTSLVAMVAAKFNNDDDDETEVVLDPLSSDFGKIKIGNTRIDPWGGRIQMITYQARMIAGAMIYGGKREELGMNGADTRGELIMKLAQNKLSPSAGLLVKFLFAEKDKDGKMKQFGKELVFSEELAGSLYPMYIGTINELWEEQPETVASFLTFYSFLGGGVSTYESNKGKIKFKDVKTKNYVNKYAPSMRGLDDSSVELEKLNQDQFNEVDSIYKKASEDILTAYVNSGDIEKKEAESEAFTKSGKVKAITVNQAEEYTVMAEKEGVKPDDIPKRVNEIAITETLFNSIKDRMSDLNGLAKDAAIEQYFKEKKIRVPLTVVGAKDAYEKTLNDLLETKN